MARVTVPNGILFCRLMLEAAIHPLPATRCYGGRHKLGCVGTSTARLSEKGGGSGKVGDSAPSWKMDMRQGMPSCFSDKPNWRACRPCHHSSMSKSDWLHCLYLEMLIVSPAVPSKFRRRHVNVILDCGVSFSSPLEWSEYLTCDQDLSSRFACRVRALDHGHYGIEVRVR